jgi:hypothetical protein
VLGMNGLTFGALIIVIGFVMYFATAKLRREALPRAVVEGAEVS